MIRNRRDYERNLNLLKEKLNLGQVQFSIQVKRSVKGILNIRIGHNGRVNLNTIDELARSTANGLVSMMNTHLGEASGNGVEKK